MRKKMLTRLGALTCSACFCYALAYQAISGDVAAAEPDYSVIESAAETPTEPAETVTETAPAQDSFHRRGKHRRWESGETYDSGNTAPAFGDAAETPDEPTEDDEDKRKSAEENQDDSAGNQTGTASGDPPTLSQFLSTLRCGGCRHGCSLLNPRCMKGRSKAERATTEYQQTYGSEHT